MTSHVQGMGWITPLGAGLDEVWSRVASGERAGARELKGADGARSHFYLPIPPKLVEALGRNPRLRRSSVISYYAAAAGLAALENAGIKMTPEVAAGTAVILAISSGGVVYTRKFYDQIIHQGANAASPLLFPETVYNAPASHLAALLGIDGMSYTLVGDSSVGIGALKLAEQLLATTDVQHCVVIGAEEVDWVLCEAYRTWRLPALLADGAAALVIGRTGSVSLEKIHAGIPFLKRTQAAVALDQVHRDMAAIRGAELVVGCANGTYIDRLEAESLARNFPACAVEFPKRAFGEALGASALQQTIQAALALEKRGLKKAVVSVLGFNEQASGLVLARA